LNLQTVIKINSDRVQVTSDLLRRYLDEEAMSRRSPDGDK